jgi:hypothetical protein
MDRVRAGECTAVGGDLGVAMALTRVPEVDGQRRESQDQDHDDRDEDENRAALVSRPQR